jgi:hypothetical protein
MSGANPLSGTLHLKKKVTISPEPAIATKRSSYQPQAPYRDTDLPPSSGDADELLRNIDREE